MDNIQSSENLKNFLFQQIGVKLLITKLTRETPKSARELGDYVIEARPPIGYEFDVNFIKHLLIENKINPSYTKISKLSCCLLVTTWNKLIVSNASFKDLLVKMDVQESIEEPIELRKLNEVKQLVELILNEGRLPNIMEKEILINYEGRGGLAKVGVRGKGILSEFYTPDPIIQKMWGLAYKNGFTANGTVLEPSCGTGRFFKYHNPALIDAFEIDPIAYNIAKLLYPKANITLGSFESKFFRGTFHLPNTKGDYDLVIGNPPYESYVSENSPKEKTITEALTFDQYFMTRGLDLLKQGGIMVILVPSSFMRNENKYNKIKDEIHSKAELIEAYRLPNGVFPNTDIGTDILVFRKI